MVTLVTFPLSSIVSLIPALPSSPAKTAGYSGWQLLIQLIPSLLLGFGLGEGGVLLVAIAVFDVSALLLLLLLGEGDTALFELLFEEVDRVVFSTGGAIACEGAGVGLVKTCFGGAVSGFTGGSSKGGGVVVLTGSGLGSG